MGAGKEGQQAQGRKKEGGREGGGGGGGREEKRESPQVEVCSGNNE